MACSLVVVEAVLTDPPVTMLVFANGHWELHLVLRLGWCMSAA